MPIDTDGLDGNVNDDALEQDRFDDAAAAIALLLCKHQPDLRMAIEVGTPFPDISRRVQPSIHIDTLVHKCSLMIQVLLTKEMQLIHRLYGIHVIHTQEFATINDATVGAVLAEMTQEHREALVERLARDGDEALGRYEIKHGLEAASSLSRSLSDLKEAMLSGRLPPEEAGDSGEN